MSNPTNRPLLQATALAGLRDAKQQIVDAAAGRVAERLVRTTAVAAVRLALSQAVPVQMASPRALELMRETLKGLARQPWKPDTVVQLSQFRQKGQA